jgi:ATP-dependent DNA helicase RecQ
VSNEVVESLDKHLRRVGIDISPRSTWPPNLPGIGIPLSGRIAKAERCLVGRAIARLSDMGWGEELAAFLADAGAETPLPMPLLELAARVVDESARDRQIQLGGIVGIRSRRRPVLLNTLLAGLAGQTKLPVLGTLLSDGTEAGAGRSNSARTVAGLHGGFAVSPDLAIACRDISGTILLVDDVVDSGWTMTLAGRALRLAGAADVMPFALATTGRRD